MESQLREFIYKNKRKSIVLKYIRVYSGWGHQQDGAICRRSHAALHDKPNRVPSSPSSVIDAQDGAIR